MFIQKLILAGRISSRSCLKCRSSFNFSTLYDDIGHTEPIIHTTIPGPVAQKLRRELDAFQNTASLKFFCDFEKSKGNFVADCDGNVLLDCFQQIATLPIGYNHPDLLNLCATAYTRSTLVNRAALGCYPPQDFPKVIQNSLARAAPPGMKQVVTMACGSCSNENAFKTAFFWYMKKQRREELPPIDDVAYIKCMENQPPGSPKLSILSFTGGFHGRTLGSLSATRCRAIHKIDVPAFDWPVADFPVLKYPLDKYHSENEKEEARCLAMAEDRIVSWKSKSPVAGMVVEPIQAEGGDRYASDDFFRKLRKLAADYGVIFICDEVQTGMGLTGKMWAHEHWNLPSPPDVVTFAKKMLTAGFFYNNELRWDSGYRVFNTWMGDPVRLLLLEKVLDVMERDALMRNVITTGSYLLSELVRLEEAYPSYFSAARGRGLFTAIDVRKGSRATFVRKLLESGIVVGICGVNTVRFRPSLIFTPTHAKILVDRLDAAAKTLA